ncbi:hypothetical protein EXIGLDRAFT_664664 [Exidia glandulosa HHB12029]|uniref:cAMP-independent regulatory protein pac2 n=1 Tax=Exidia glandulosa HHB12029 TaxID=1314781 RepID=A0A165Q426_EXIGL|nr:hypothetical protein EXIGLDRAFT_664664 [Exidia glandulosa HHB12029]
MATSRHTTHPTLHIRNANDAHVIFEAVRLGILPIIKRRLAPVERDLLRSGEVFVWEEAEHKGSLERWTDGRRWSQSRMREPFLFYEEKVQTTTEEKEAKAARRAQQRTTDPVTGLPVTLSVPNPVRRQDRPNKPGGLTKQTYSAFVLLPGTTSYRKWHLVAYFSAADYMRLPVIDNYPELRAIRVPDGIYVSGKSLPSAGGVRRYTSEDDDDYPPRPMTADSARSAYATQDPRYAHLTRPTMPRTLSTVSSSGYSDSDFGRPTSSSSSHLYSARPEATMSPMSPHHLQGSLASIPRDALPHRPEYTRQLSSPSYSNSAHGVPARSTTPAYSRHAVAVPGRTAPIPIPSDPHSPLSSYATRSPEDARILDAFRLGL